MSHQQTSARAARILLAAGTAVLLAACSSDIERLSDYPPIDNTQSVTPTKVTSAPVAPPAQSSSPWNNPTPSWARTQSGRSTWQPPQSRTVASQPAYQPPRQAANGAVIVQPGQTLFSIARANGKSVQELMAANGMSTPTIKVGQRIVIPGVANPVSPAPTVARVQRANGADMVTLRPTAAPQPKRQNTASTRRHRVQPGETWYALGRKYRVHPRKIAAHNGLSLSSGLKVGQVVKIPAADGWNMPAARTTRVSERPKDTARKDQERIRVAERPQATPQPPKPQSGSKPASTAGSDFIWPVRGQVIGAFGKQANGQRNDGIDIAAPAGTPVRAAASGTVAYAGNELKAYGNLVLIRHPGGWVTAYAYNSKLSVKRGDYVKQGQKIAEVGQTGIARTPQLHFELRKGATPVNPLKYLGNMATAMR